MKVCIAGKNRIATEALQLLLKHYTEISVVACKNATDDGVNSWQPSFEFFCKKNNIPLVTINELYEEKDLVLISLEYDKIIRTERFRSNRLFNIHFSKLPAYKGMFTSVMPLLHGETESGVTLHYIDKGIDTGFIIDQISFPLSQILTARELYELYLTNGLLLFKKNLAFLLNDQFSAVPQPAVGSTYFSKRTLDFSNIVIDLNKTAFEINNQIRAFTFREYQLPKVFDKPIYKSQITEQIGSGKPGTVIHEDDWVITVNTVDYNINLFKDKGAELVQAATEGDINFFQKLERAGFPVHTKTRKGWNALIIACYHDQIHFIKHLYNKGWDLNATNYKGTTAVMYAMTVASKEGKRQVLDFLIDKVDLTRKDDLNRDIFSYAQEYGNRGVINFLNKYKSN